MGLPEPQEYYTYADYVTWDSEERYELIDGVPYLMAAPGVAHQRVLLQLARQLGDFLEGRPCELFVAPFDVRLFSNPWDEDDSDDTIVQPDLLVVCDPYKIQNGKSCKGAPNFVIEILSPSSSKMDRLIKLNRYQRAGVAEYWILDPEGGMLEQYILRNKMYLIQRFDGTETVPVTVLPGCNINLNRVLKEGSHA